MVRYLIKANGTVIGHAETESKAWKKAHKYSYECENQDVPCYPKMKVIKEEIK